MTTLTSSVGSPSSTNNVSISLCVSQPGVDDRTVELGPGKSTVGSSERCQVCIDDPNARPLHCLFVREGASVSVTRWAAGVLINGNEFATSPFEMGDCLQIGAVQMSLVVNETADGAPSPAPRPQSIASPAQPVVSSPFAPAKTSELEDAVNELTTTASVVVQPTLSAAPSPTGQQDVLVTRLEAARETARSRCRKLLAVLRSMRSEANEFQVRANELQRQLDAAVQERAQIFAQLSELQATTDEQQNQAAQEVDRLISELAVAYEKASDAESAVETATQNANAHREQVATAQSTIADLEAWAQATQTELAELRGRQQQWEQVREAGELQRSKLAQTLADSQRTIDTLRGELQQLRQAADHADEGRMQQAAALESVEEELDAARQQREQLLSEQIAAQQYQAELEQALADSEQNLEVFQLELEKFQLTSRQTDQELASQTEEFEKLQAEVAQIRDERDQLVTKRTEYQLREQGWEHELAGRDSKIEELSSEIQQLRSSIEEATQGTAEQIAQVEHSQQQVDALSIEREQLLATQAEQLESLKAWEEAVAARDQRIAELESEHEGICEVLQSVEKGAFEQVDTCNKLQKQLATMREERDQFAKALPEQRKYIEQLETTLSERDGQVALLGDELTKTLERQTQLETQLADGTSAYQALEMEMRELNARCDLLAKSQDATEQAKAASDDTLASYQQQIETLTEQIEASQQQQQQLQQVVAEGSLSVEVYEAELTDLRGRFEQLTQDHQVELDRRQQLDTELVERDQNLELFQVDLRSVEAELQRTTTQVADLEGERETLNRQLTGLREELAACDSREAEPTDELRRERDELADELDSVRRQLEELQRRVSDEETATATIEPSQADALPVDAPSPSADTFDEQLPAEAPCEEQVATESRGDYDPAAEIADWGSFGHAETDTTTAGFHDAYAADVEGYEVADEYSDQPATEEDPVEWTEAEPTEDESPEIELPETDSAEESSAAELSWGTPHEEATDELNANAFDQESDSEAEIVLSEEPPAAKRDAFDKQDSSDPEPTQEFKPTSFIDQYQHLLEDDGNDSLYSQQQPQPQPVERENRLAAELDAAENDQDDSDEALQAYMENMLARMRGEVTDEQQPTAQSDRAEQLSQAASSAPAMPQVPSLDSKAETQPEGATVCEDPIDLESLKRSSAKPDLPTDLAAMRELANSSARKAIATHHKRRHWEKATGFFFICLVAVCVGAYMLWAAIAEQRLLGVNFIGGSIAAVVGSIGVVKLFGVVVSAVRGRASDTTAS